LKADSYLIEMIKWIRSHIKDAFEVQYKGQAKPIMNWLKGSSVRAITGIADSEHGNVKDIFEAVASYIFSGYFEAIAPDYPAFSQWITGDSMQGAAQDVLSYLAGGAATKRATAVMDALGLLEGDKLRATKSRYAITVLDILQAKGHGQVVNNSELLERVNARLYFKPDSYRLEPEWLLVILASLVHSGELELSVVGHNISASDTTLFKTVSFDTLKDFKHIQAPKDFNTSAIKALLEMLDMNEGLAISIQNGDDGVVRTMGEKIDDYIRVILRDQQNLKDRLPLWGQHVLEEAEAQTLNNKLTETKIFLEEQQRFNTPGKLKNLKVTVAEIEAQTLNLEAWREYKQLKEVVGDLTPMVDYLKNAQLILAEDDDWQEQAKNIQQSLRAGLLERNTRLDANFKEKMLKQLGELKKAYIQRFVEQYQRARLTLVEDQVKAKLISDSRLISLETLAGITLLPAEHLKKWRESWAGLQVAESIEPKMLEVNPQPVAFNPRANTWAGQAKDRLYYLDDQLDSMLKEWTLNLKNNLADPFIQLDLLKASQKENVNSFISSGKLPEPLSREFIEEVNKVLSGLEQVNISIDELVSRLGKGTPQSVEEIRKRFEILIQEHCKGKDSEKIRIIIE
ncbi:hypothetical protein LCGC14_1500350, partial [marine sediment metagenome]